MEFVTAVTRPLADGRLLLEPGVARREAEEFLHQSPILHPSEDVVRIAVHGAAAYGPSWFDAHLWPMPKCMARR